MKSTSKQRVRKVVSRWQPASQVCRTSARDVSGSLLDPDVTQCCHRCGSISFLVLPDFAPSFSILRTLMFCKWSASGGSPMPTLAQRRGRGAKTCGQHLVGQAMPSRATRRVLIELGVLDGIEIAKLQDSGNSWACTIICLPLLAPYWHSKKRIRKENVSRISKHKQELE